MRFTRGLFPATEPVRNYRRRARECGGGEATPLAALQPASPPAPPGLYPDRYPGSQASVSRPELGSYQSRVPDFFCTYIPEQGSRLPPIYTNQGNVPDLSFCIRPGFQTFAVFLPAESQTSFMVARAGF